MTTFDRPRVYDYTREQIGDRASARSSNSRRDSMDETLKRLAEERALILRDLSRNTAAMRQASEQAQTHGLRPPTIAKKLGVTKRTVYRWIQ